MKYIKTYENIKDEPQIGDYVVCNVKIGPDGMGEVNLSNFVRENIGLLIDIKGITLPNYCVKFDDIPENVEYEVKVEDKVIVFGRNEIVYWSKNKEDLEIFIQANKYNL